MKKKNDEFYVSYIEGSLGDNTKRIIKRFGFITLFVMVGAAVLFALSQKTFKNSSFELTSETKVTGIFHESPYPMLRVELAENTFKSIVLLGFGKSSANPFLQKLKSAVSDLEGKKIAIEGNLIYYNGKTLIQITDDEKVTLVTDSTVQVPDNELVGEVILEGEIIDPKCYFGVMKPGKGKIHRSCAVRCISGGIPPVLATKDSSNVSSYYLLTDTDGNPIHQEILPYVGQPAKMKGVVEKNDDWHVLKIDIADIDLLGVSSSIY